MASHSTGLSPLVALKNKEAFVYETKEDAVTATTAPPPAVKAKTGLEQKSDDVDTNNLRPQLAFEQFAGKVYSRSAAEFADGDLRGKLRQVSSQRAEFVSFPPSEQIFESPLERFNRLKEEIAQFQQDMQVLSGKAASKDDAPANVSIAISKELSKLETDLGSMVHNKAFRTFLDPSYRDASDLEQKNLMDKLMHEMGKAGGLVKSDETKAAGTGGKGQITYELYYNPQRDGTRTLASLVDLDKRISIIEKCLGVANEDKSFSFPDVHAALVHLSKRLELLDNHKLEGVNRQLKSLMGDIEAFHQVKETAEQGNAQNEKINKLYEMMTKWDESSEQLPFVISRLQSLRELHEESAATVMRVQSMDNDQAEITRLLTHDKQALDRVEKNLASNLKVMQNNVKTLEARITELNSKFEKLK